MKTCQICLELKKTRKAIIREMTGKGWQKSTLNMCSDCIEDEGATLKYKRKAA